MDRNQLFPYILKNARKIERTFDFSCVFSNFMIYYVYRVLSLKATAFSKMVDGLLSFVGGRLFTLR